MEFINLKAQYAALQSSIQARMNAVLAHGQYIMGPEVKALEEALAQRIGARHCITVSSGTEALLISLMALGLKPGDEVITTPFTFAATVEVILLLGGVPVFVDVEPTTGLMDAGLIEAAIGPRTRAIMPVSLYGQVPDMDAIHAVAARHGHLPVIEDAAQSFGATITGVDGRTRHSGHTSTLGCTSFFPSKPLGCYGDGGAIFTDDDALAQAAREIRVHGQSARYTHTRLGVGGRMDTLQCAVVLAKLERFDWELTQRERLGRRYGELLASKLPGLRLLEVKPGRQCVWGQYTVFVERREFVVSYLKDRGIPTAVHYPVPMHLQSAYAAHRAPGPLTHSEACARQVLSLPMSADLTEAEQDTVVATLVEAVQAAAACAEPS